MSHLKRDKNADSKVLNLGENLLLSLDLLNKDKGAIQFTRFSELNKIMDGFRMGELTLISGHTGKGKTTFLSEYALDLALNGVKVCQLLIVE